VGQRRGHGVIDLFFSFDSLLFGGHDAVIDGGVGDGGVGVGGVDGGDGGQGVEGVDGVGVGGWWWRWEVVGVRVL